jgi:hypothetical protein
MKSFGAKHSIFWKIFEKKGWNFKGNAKEINVVLSSHQKNYWDDGSRILENYTTALSLCFILAYIGKVVFSQAEEFYHGINHALPCQSVRPQFGRKAITPPKKC